MDVVAGVDRLTAAHGRLFVAIGVFALICACAAFFLWVDAANMWCTFFPFLGGCP